MVQKPIKYFSYVAKSVKVHNKEVILFTKASIDQTKIFLSTIAYLAIHLAQNKNTQALGN